jgi:hypothetical protein
VIGGGRYAAPGSQLKCLRNRLVKSPPPWRRHYPSHPPIRYHIREDMALQNEPWKFRITGKRVRSLVYRPTRDAALDAFEPRRTTQPAHRALSSHHKAPAAPSRYRTTQHLATILFDRVAHSQRIQNSGISASAMEENRLGPSSNICTATATPASANIAFEPRVPRVGA